MVSHGERSRELNLWVSKLRNYKTKRGQNVDHEPGYTLHKSQHISEKDGDGLLNGVSVTEKVSTTDLHQCVELLSHLLDTDGSLMGGPTMKKVATKPKKKGVHVIPRPKTVGRTVVKGVASKGNVVKGIPPGKAVRSGMKRSALSGPDTELQWLDGDTAVNRLSQQDQATHRKSLHIPTATDEYSTQARPTQITRLQQEFTNDVSGPVPYNKRLTSSTPNNTLLRDLEPTQQVPDCIRPVTATMMKQGPVATSAAYQCVHSKLKAPGLPLVFLNTDYNLTEGQCHPLNASDQVNIIKPPEPDSVPKLVQGRVEFKPNPSAWFQGAKPGVEPRPGNSGIVSHPYPVTNHLSSGPISPFKADRNEVPSRDVYQGLKPNYRLDPAEKENMVDFSLYTNPGDAVNVTNAHQGSAQSGGTHQMAAHVAGDVTTRDVRAGPYNNSNLPTGVSAVPTGVSSAPTGVSSAPTGVSTARTGVSLASKAVPIKASSRSWAVTQKEKSKFHESKVKRVSSKDLNTTCRRCAKFDRKNQSLKNKENIMKNKENILKLTVKNQPRADKAVQFTINDAATQCSPEKLIKIPTEIPEVTTTSMDHNIPHQSLRHMLTLQRLLAEVKLVVKSEESPSLDLLMKQIEQTAAMFVPGLGGIDWRTEMELALQPLRSENAQLRRRLRISNQQMKDKSSQLELKDKPDPSFQTVHLELQRHKLEQDYKEVVSSRDQFRDRLKALQAELDHLRAERAKLLEIMVHKDTELQKCEERLTADVTRYRGDSERSQEEINRMLRDKDITQNQIQVLHVSVQQRDSEISRLRDIVKNLQTSMTRLLGQLRNMTPPDDLIDLFVDGQGNDLLDENTLDGQSLLDRSPHTPDGHHGNEDILERMSRSPPSSARRSLPFSRTSHNKVSNHTSPKRVERSPHANTPINTITSSPRHNKYTESWMDAHMDETDYVVAPGTSPLKRFHPTTQRLLEAEGTMLTPRTESTHTSTDSPTVKELLTPLKDRLQSQYKRLSKGGAEPPADSSGGSTGVMHINILPEEDTLTDLEVAPLEVDTTLLGSLDSTDSMEGDQLHTVHHRQDYSAQNVTESKLSMEEASRYSMTDYFKKYPRDGNTESTKHCVSDLIKENISPDTTSDIADDQNYPYNRDNNDSLSGDVINYAPLSPDHDIMPLMRSSAAEVNNHMAPSVNRSSIGQASFQDSMYKGTELDTSISTIDDGTSLESSAMTVSSVGTIDDSAFQQGLADLDANIAKIQEELKFNLAKYS